MIDVEHLSKNYGSAPAIQDVVFRVEPGEILGFLGPNGAGKTTTMRILTGYLPATSGTARIAGFDVHTQSMQVRRHIGYLPEIPPLYPGMTVASYLHFVAKIKGVRAGDRASQVKKVIQQCGLDSEANTLIRKLSKGFRQRVGLAQALVHNPPVIILDEPTVGLDPRQISEVRRLIKSLAGERTIILSTHILPEVSVTCDRVTIINQGHIVATDTPENLMAKMVGGTNYTVEVSGWRDSVLEKIEQIEAVEQVEVMALEGSDRHTLNISCFPGAEPGSAITLTAIHWGLQVHEVRRSRPSLEEVFLELTTQEEPLPDSGNTLAEGENQSPIASSENLESTSSTSSSL